MERIINERLSWGAENQIILDPNQNGFRRGRFCGDNLLKLTMDIKIHIAQGCYVLAAFLDISSAYDNVRHSNLMKILMDKKCPIKISKFINEWLYSRETKFVINHNESTSKTVFKGLPQGAVLSPLLYAIYTSDISKNLNKEINIVQFANDIAIYIGGGNRQRNRKLLEMAVKSVADKLEDLGLALQHYKTELMEVSKHGNIDRNMFINIKNSRNF